MNEYDKCDCFHISTFLHFFTFRHFSMPSSIHELLSRAAELEAHLTDISAKRAARMAERERQMKTLEFMRPMSRRTSVTAEVEKRRELRRSISDLPDLQILRKEQILEGLESIEHPDRPVTGVVLMMTTMVIVNRLDSLCCL